MKHIKPYMPRLSNAEAREQAMKDISNESTNYVRREQEVLQLCALPKITIQLGVL